jgi:hypothetical protein
MTFVISAEFNENQTTLARVTEETHSHSDWKIAQPLERLLFELVRYCSLGSRVLQSHVHMLALAGHLESLLEPSTKPSECKVHDNV